MSNILYGHLRHQLKADEASVDKVLLVLAHLDSIQPLIHCAERGEVWSGAIKQR